MEPVMLISDLASRTGLSIHTINYYIQLGLVLESARAERSGYRLFNLDTVRILEEIIQLRRRNVTIKELVARKRDGLL